MAENKGDGNKKVENILTSLCCILSPSDSSEDENFDEQSNTEKCLLCQRSTKDLKLLKSLDNSFIKFALEKSTIDQIVNLDMANICQADIRRCELEMGSTYAISENIQERMHKDHCAFCNLSLIIQTETEETGELDMETGLFVSDCQLKEFINHRHFTSVKGIASKSHTKFVKFSLRLRHKKTNKRANVRKCVVISE